MKPVLPNKLDRICFNALMGLNHPVVVEAGKWLVSLLIIGLIGLAGFLFYWIGTYHPMILTVLVLAIGLVLITSIARIVVFGE